MYRLTNFTYFYLPFWFQGELMTNKTAGHRLTLPEVKEDVYTDL